MNQVYICDYIRTPIGRFGGSLSSVRTDDLGAVPIRALMTRHGGTKCQLRRCVISDFSNHQDVRVQTHCGLDRIREGPEAGFFGCRIGNRGLYRALDRILGRIFDRNDIPTSTSLFDD